jgi:hypothetical protein
MQTTPLRELEPAEIEQLSGGNPLATIGGGTIIGAISGGATYSYNIAVSGGTFDGGAFTASILQGATIGFLGTLGGVMFTVPGGMVAGVSAEGLATVITATNPAGSFLSTNSN